MLDAKIYASNAVAMWNAIGEVDQPAEAVSRIRTRRATRLILHRPMPELSAGDLIALQPPGTRVIVEDCFGACDPAAPTGVVVKRMPVMIRPPGPLTPTGNAIPVSTPQQLQQAGQAIVDGFPVPGATPDQILPPHVLGLPGWTVWLDHLDDSPAAAGYTFDDGTVAGVYLLATVPDARGRGLGRAIMTAALAAIPHRPAALVATNDGEPLYRTLGFTSVASSAWYIRSPVD